jgi:hypothetical protein
MALQWIRDRGEFMKKYIFLIFCLSDCLGAYAESLPYTAIPVTNNLISARAALNSAANCIRETNFFKSTAACLYIGKAEEKFAALHSQIGDRNTQTIYYTSIRLSDYCRGELKKEDALNVISIQQSNITWALSHN